MSHINSTFFALTKELSPSTFNNIIEEQKKLKFQKELFDLKIYDKNLLFWATAFDNERLIDELLKIDGFKNKNYLQQSLEILYSNKNPIILVKLISEIELLPKNEISEIAQFIFPKVSLNCYREENIYFLSNFLFNHLSENEQKEFIQQSIKSNNLPILNFLIRSEKWEAITKTILNEDKPFYQEKLPSYFFSNKIQLTQPTSTSITQNLPEFPSFELSPIQSTDKIKTENIPQTVIIKKKKKITSI